MSTLRLDFEGYFQYRIATDPDPEDELRGVSGYTFALAGEPDLDRIAHFQPDEKGVYQRRFGIGDKQGENLPVDDQAHGPRVGVTVRRASDPSFVGARVQFQGAQILEYNGILIRNDMFVIDPVHVRIYHEKDKPLLERNDWINPADPTMPIWEATGAMLERRQPATVQSNSPMVAAALGLPDAANKTLIDNRLARRKSLEELRRKTKDPTERAALETRIQQLDIVEQWWNLAVGTWDNRPIDRRAHQLTLLFDGWNIGMQGKVFANTVNADETQPWPLQFWMGGFDGDALTAYVRGTWTVPLSGVR